jgi:hypothetical protein
MKRCALLGVLVAWGCADGGADSDFPVEPNGTVDPTGMGTSGDGEAVVRGRVCRVTNLLDLAACLNVDVGGLEVSLGDTTTITDAAGNFVLPATPGSFQAFTVRGAGAITTTTPFSPSLTLPVVDADVWARALASNQIFAIEGAGSILGTVARAGVPATGIVVGSTPAGAFTPLFDGEAGFTPTATGARGVFFLPGVTFGAADLTLRDTLTGGVSTVAGIQVINGGVTILDSVPIP